MNPGHSAEYVAVPQDWCIAHQALVIGDNYCEFTDSYETPCVFRQLFYRRHNDGVDDRPHCAACGHGGLHIDGSEGDGLCTDETPCGNCSRPDPPALIDGSRRSEAGAVVPDPGKWPL